MKRSQTSVKRASRGILFKAASDGEFRRKESIERLHKAFNGVVPGYIPVYKAYI